VPASQSVPTVQSVPSARAPAADDRPPADPHVSVVLPTTRGGAYLREAVRSVLSQSLRNLELIVVADGCADELHDLDVLDPRIRIIRQARRGVSIARNVGVRAARTDLIAFVDDDDRMLPDRLDAQFRAMADQLDVAICHSQFVFINESGALIANGYARKVDYLDLLSGELGVLMPTTMMRKSLLQEAGMFDAALRTCQDVDVILRLAKGNRLIFLPATLTQYRVHGDNASADPRLAGQVLEEVIGKHLRSAQRSGDVEVVAAARAGVTRARGLASGGHILEARLLWRQRHRLAAARLIATAIRLSPEVTLRDLGANRRWVRAARAAVKPIRRNGRAR
jgi:GT2 family glycosyltransferase